MIDPGGPRALAVRCCVAGGGPAGMLLGFLLARAGVPVTVLEKHADFLRDFRGDTVHPSTLQILDEVGLLPRFEKLRQTRVQQIGVQIGGRLQPVIDFRGLQPFDYVALVPQWDFLDLLADEAARFPHFDLRLRHEAVGLIEERGAVVGVRARSPEGELAIRAEVVVGCDGRNSTLRAAAGLRARDYGAPMDVLWFRLPRDAESPTPVFAVLERGRILVLLNRIDYWQTAVVVPKGSDSELRARPIAELRASIGALAPFLVEAARSLASWDDVKTLEVRVDRLECWTRPGLLLIGDAAHAMSPIGGVGINLAIQDAVAAANALAPALRAGEPIPESLLRGVERRRMLPTRLIQSLQLQAQQRVISQVLAKSKSPLEVPAMLRWLLRHRAVRGIPARLMGYGFRRESVRTGQTAMRAVAPLIAAILFAASIPWLSGCQAASHAAPADLVLVNGAVLTVDDGDRIAEAVAVRGEKIAAVGTTAQVDALAGPSTRRIDLQGRAITPGLLDAHAHFSPSSFNRLDVLDLSYPRVKSIAEIQTLLAQRARERAEEGWIQGRGWDEGKLAERRLITARDLDAVIADRPVWLSHTMGHYGVANSAALRLAKIERNSPDPPGGTIERDAEGNATGVLKETAQDLVTGLIPPPGADEIERGIAEMARAFNAECMTGVKDPGVSDAAWDAYARVLARGDLTVRVFALWEGGRTLGAARALIARRASMTRPYESTGDDRLIAGGVKLYADGSGGARTAWMYDDWNVDVTGMDTGNRGYPNIDPRELREMIRLLHDAGFHVSTHAVGDRAIDVVVDAYLEAMRASPRPGLRHGIIHANVPSERALAGMAELQREYDAGYPEPSATFMWWIGDTYAGNFGPRARRLNPFNTYQQRGIRWANGSDYSVTPFPARYGIWASIAREPALGIYGGDPFGRDQAIDVRAALRAATLGPAHQMFLERKTGSIEVGKYADLAVWDRDPYRVETADLKDMQCQMTLLGGKVVYAIDGTW